MVRGRRRRARALHSGDWHRFFCFLLGGAAAVRIMFKASKVVPVMLASVVMQGTKYSLVECVGTLVPP